MKIPKPKKPTYEQLETELAQYKAASRMTLKMAYSELDRTDHDRFMGSGLIVTIKNLKGKEVVSSFLCVDGFEPDTIKALKAEVKKTRDLNDSLSF